MPEVSGKWLDWFQITERQQHHSDSTSRLTMVLWDLVPSELCQYGPEDHFQNRVASIAQRMQAVLKRQWSPTRYEQGGPAEAAVSVLGQLVACLICVSRLSQTAITDHGSSK